MDAKQVIDKIRGDAQSRADEITSQAERELSRQQAELDKQISQYNEQTEALAAKAGQEKKEHILAAARMEIAKEYLREKRRILDEVFNDARTQFLTMEDAEYLGLMTDLMKKAVETGDEEVIVDPNELRIDMNFIKKINRELGPGFQGKLRLSEDRLDIDGGFILRRGDVMINASVDVLLSQARKALEIELARDLFGQ